MADAPSVAVDLRADGVLWAINRAVFHPRGFALDVDTTGALTLLGDGSEVWVYCLGGGDMPTSEDDLFRSFEALLGRARVANHG